MDEDPEVLDGAEDEPPSRMSAGAAVAIVLAVLLALGLSIYFGVAQTVTGLFVIIGIPLALLWFVWNVFLRRLWRVRRIRGAQERRELMEAAMRDKEQTMRVTKEHEE